MKTTLTEKWQPTFPSWPGLDDYDIVMMIIMTFYLYNDDDTDDHHEEEHDDDGDDHSSYLSRADGPGPWRKILSCGEISKFCT